MTKTMNPANALTEIRTAAPTLADERDRARRALIADHPVPMSDWQRDEMDARLARTRLVRVTRNITGKGHRPLFLRGEIVLLDERTDTTTIPGVPLQFALSRHARIWSTIPETAYTAI